MERQLGLLKVELESSLRDLAEKNAEVILLQEVVEKLNDGKKKSE